MMKEIAHAQSVDATVTVTVGRNAEGNGTEELVGGIVGCDTMTKSITLRYATG